MGATKVNPSQQKEGNVANKTEIKNTNKNYFSISEF